MVISLIVTCLGIAGIAGAFIGFTPLIFIGAVADIFENIYNDYKGEQKSIVTLVIGIVVGAGYALFTKGSILAGVMLGLCWESVIIGAGSLVFLVLLVGAPQKNKHK